MPSSLWTYFSSGRWDTITHLAAHFRRLQKAWKPAEVLTELHERGSMQSSFLPPPSNHNYKALVSHTKDIVAVWYYTSSMQYKYINEFITNKLHKEFHLSTYTGDYYSMCQLFLIAILSEHWFTKDIYIYINIYIYKHIYIWSYNLIFNFIDSKW